MTYTDNPADLPDPRPEEVQDPLGPVEVPEPEIEDTPERA